MKKGLLILLAALSLSACKEVQFTDGRIPAEYLKEAKSFEGTYFGQFEKQNGSLTIAFDGDRPIVTFTSHRGDNDILGGDCRSSIGAIKSAAISSKKVSAVSFAFDPGNCTKIEGKSLVIKTDKLKSKGLLRVEVLDHTETYNYVDCDKYACMPDTETVYFYLNGKFKRQ